MDAGADLQVAVGGRAQPEAQTLLIVSEPTVRGAPTAAETCREGIIPTPACSTSPITT